jgi:hypothetical protein
LIFLIKEALLYFQTNQWRRKKPVFDSRLINVKSRTSHFVQESISSTFFVRLFRTKAFFLVTFWVWMNFCTKNMRVKRWWNWRQESISSMFYARVFCKKCWHQKLQSCVLCLKFFGAKILYEKRSCKTLIKLTPDSLLERDESQQTNHFVLRQINFFLLWFWPIQF